MAQADGRPVRVTRRRAETRGRLLDAAFTVFAARGFGQARIEEVCEAAGYSRGAFYSNFGSLEELFFVLHEERSRRITDQVRAALAKVAPGTSVLGLAGFVADALVVDRNWILVKTDFLLHASRNPEVGVALTHHRTALRETLSTLLDAAVDRSGLPSSLRSADGLARAVIAVHDGAMAELLLDLDPAALRGWLTDIMVALLDHPAQE